MKKGLLLALLLPLALSKAANVGPYQNIPQKKYPQLIKDLASEKYLSKNVLVLRTGSQDPECEEMQCQSLLASFSLVVGSLTGQFSQSSNSKKPQKLINLPVDYLFTPFHGGDTTHAKFVLYRNGVPFPVEASSHWKQSDYVNKALVRVLQAGQKVFLQNLRAVDSFDDDLIYGRKGQDDLKHKQKPQIEYCVAEGIREGTQGYQQTMPLLAEDIPDVMFYTKEQEDSESIAFWCRDKYYHDEKYTFLGVWNYQEMFTFVMNSFKYRNLQLITRELILHCQDTSTPIAIYVRDETEPETSLIDMVMAETMRDYRASSQARQMVFAVSDMKEGFEKDFWDNLGFYDTDVPFLIVLDPNQTHPRKYLFPSNSSFSFEGNFYPPPSVSTLVQYLKVLNTTSPYYHTSLTPHPPQALSLLASAHLTPLTSIQLHTLLTEDTNSAHIVFVFFCSLAGRHECITDLRGLQVFYRLASGEVRKVGARNRERLRMYYMDTEQNEVSDGFHRMEQIPCIRGYKRSGGEWKMQEMYPEALKMREEAHMIEEWMATFAEFF